MRTSTMPVEAAAAATDGVVGSVSKCEDEVRDFCARHGVYTELDTAVGFAKEHFGDCNPRLSVSRDPEGDSEWIVIDVETSKSVGDALAAHDAFTVDLLRSVRVEAIPLICLVYNFI